MVEVYLITAFHDKDEVECVGHAWNEYGGTHFDITAGLIKNEKVKSNTYFSEKTYLYEDASIYIVPFTMGKLQLSFSTKVKDNEKNVRDYLNNIT